MPQFRIHKVYYSKDPNIVTIAVEAVDGPFKGQLKDLYTSQAKIAARPGSDAWNAGDEQLLAEAAALLGEMGAELVTEGATEDAPAEGPNS